MTKQPSSPRTARPCPTAARRPAPILSSRYPEDPAKPAHRLPTLAAGPTNAAAPRPTLDRTPSATCHFPTQQPRSLHAEKSPNGTASENLGASRKPPPAFSAPGHLERRSTSTPRASLLWNSETAHGAKPLNETHARQPSEVRARRRSRRRPGLRRLISREVRNLAGVRCSRRRLDRSANPLVRCWSEARTLANR